MTMLEQRGGDRAAAGLRDVLENEIVEGVHAPGARLDESALAARFNVSRTPIREALQALEASGLIELKPRRGAFVRRVGAAELIEMFEVMAEFEAVCARFAAARLSADAETRLLAAHEACAAAARDGDSDAYYFENEAFHGALYAAAGNSFMAEQARALQTRLKPFRRHQLRARGRMARSLAEHEAIVAAVRGGDPEAADAAIRAHIVIQGSGFLSLVAALERERGLTAEAAREAAS